jgi:hypothetical protein
MSGRARFESREARKQRVLAAAKEGGRTMTARELAMAVGWPVSHVSKVLTALVYERRLIKAGSMVAYYKRRGSSKEIGTYRTPPSVDESVLPAWLRCPVAAP